MSDQDSPPDSDAGLIGNAERYRKAGMPPGLLTPQAADGLGDMLTVVLVSLEQLAGQALTQRASRQVARADTAAHRAGEMLWQALDADVRRDAACLPSPALPHESRP